MLTDPAKGRQSDEGHGIIQDRDRIIEETSRLLAETRRSRAEERRLHAKETRILHAEIERLKRSFFSGVSCFSIPKWWLTSSDFAVGTQKKPKTSYGAAS